MMGATLLRVFVQMPFSKAPDCKELDTKFELDRMIFAIHHVPRWWPQVASPSFRALASRHAMSQVHLTLKSRAKLGGDGSRYWLGAGL
jgi:hypothetical protein